MSKILTDELDPQKFLDEYHIIEEKATTLTKGIFPTQLLISVAYYLLGNYDEVEKRCCFLLSINTKGIWKKKQKILHGFLAFLYYSMDRYDEGEKQMSIMETLLEGEVLLKIDQGAVDAYRIEQAMANGYYKMCETYLRNKIKAAKNKLSLVENHLNLGELCLKTDRIPEAIENFQYVIENGNKIVYVKTAKEKLALLTGDKT